MQKSEWTGKLIVMNTLDIYFECGLKAGRAMTNQDASLAKFQRDWFARALHLEQPEYRIKARAEYDKGYKQGRGL